MRRFALAAIFSLAALPLAAQPQPLGPPPPEVDAAVKKYQGGDLNGAIALLEPLKGQPGTHPAALSLLGTLYLEAGRPADSLALLGPLADGERAGPVILHNAARAARALGDLAKAEVYLERAVAKAPVSPASRDLGLLRGSQGRIAESYALLRPWALANPGDQQSRLSAAFGAIELDRPPEAEELLQGLPENGGVLLLRGRLHLLKRDLPQAVATLEPLLQGGPPELDLEVRRYLAQARLALGESSAAIGLLQGKVGSDPSLALLLAHAQYQAGDPAKTAATLEPFARDLLAKQPATPRDQQLAADFALEYGQALVALSRWADAVAALEVATRFAPQSLAAWQMLGRAQAAAGRRDDAARSAEKLRQLQGTQQENSARLSEMEQGEKDPTGRNLEQAKALSDAGRTDEALARIRKEIPLAPSDPRPRTAEINLLLGAKRPQEALTAAEQALQAAPGNPEFIYLRGTVRMTLYRLPDAEKDFRQVLRLKPGHVAAMNDLAVLLMTLDRKDEAREMLRKVLEINPGNAMATANLKSLEE
jgi:cellulose synthase operon protein C